jgi:serine/threonine protein kinase
MNGKRLDCVQKEALQTRDGREKLYADERITVKAMDFVKRLLMVDPSLRYSATEALEDEFIRSHQSRWTRVKRRITRK